MAVWLLYPEGHEYTVPGAEGAQKEEGKNLSKGHSSTTFDPKNTFIETSISIHHMNGLRAATQGAVER